MGTKPSTCRSLSRPARNVPRVLVALAINPLGRLKSIAQVLLTTLRYCITLALQAMERSRWARSALTRQATCTEQPSKEGLAAVQCSGSGRSTQIGFSTHSTLSAAATTELILFQV